MDIFDKNMDLLSKSLDLYLVRHSVITDNIANAETPFFKARKVDFEGELQRAIDTRESGFPVERELAGVRPVVYEDAEAEVGQDRNTVDMDREMSALTKNDIKYTAATQAITRKFAILKYAIGETGGGN